MPVTADHSEVGVGESSNSRRFLAARRLIGISRFLKGGLGSDTHWMGHALSQFLKRYTTHWMGHALSHFLKRYNFH